MRAWCYVSFSQDRAGALNARSSPTASSIVSTTSSPATRSGPIDAYNVFSTGERKRSQGASMTNRLAWLECSALYFYLFAQRACGVRRRRWIVKRL